MTLVQKTLKNQKGLTLIELLAVIVILGIIAAIAVPSIGGIISKSQDKAIVSEAVNIIAAAKIAHASAVGGVDVVSWELSDLEDYMPEGNVKHGQEDLVVTFEDGVYTIDNHDAIDLDDVVSGAESDLTNYLTNNN